VFSGKYNWGGSVKSLSKLIMGGGGVMESSLRRGLFKREVSSYAVLNRPALFQSTSSTVLINALTSTSICGSLEELLKRESSTSIPRRGPEETRGEDVYQRVGLCGLPWSDVGRKG
jgi:hypothetical protein